MSRPRRAATDISRPELVITGRLGDTEATATARAVLQPEVQSALTARAFTGTELPSELMGLVGELEAQVRAANDGDLARPEAMLVAQAHSLDAIFHSLARKAARAEYVDHLDRYLRLALRAQAQCSRTLEVLGELKNPQPVTFVRQANVAHGPQQVNNGIAAPAAVPTPPREAMIPPNQLLEQVDGQRLDTRAPGTAGAANPALETVGAVYRAEDT
jgi:hypothetical protein